MLRRSLLALTIAALVGVPAVHAQGTSGPTISDTRVGYITSALPLDQVRLRYDAAYNNGPFANRDEYFYAAGQPLGPGLPLPEKSVSYQDVSLYGETLVAPNASIFAEAFVRWLNPVVNSDTMGIGDAIVGGKWAFVETECTVATLLLRTYVPTGDANRGLGTRHVSIEPGFLALQKLTDRINMEAELMLWTPIGGSDFAGDIVRYGVGLSYNLTDDPIYRIAPVVEMVGWTSLGGQKSEVVANGPPVVLDADGDTIINLKLGVRARLGPHVDAYAGWGHAITDQTWYHDVARFEIRFLR